MSNSPSEGGSRTAASEAGSTEWYSAHGSIGPDITDTDDQCGGNENTNVTEEPVHLADTLCNALVERFVLEVSRSYRPLRLPYQVVIGASKSTVGYQIHLGLTIMCQGVGNTLSHHNDFEPHFREGARWLRRKYQEWGGWELGMTGTGGQGALAFVEPMSPQELFRNFQMLFDDIKEYLTLGNDGWELVKAPSDDDPLQAEAAEPFQPSTEIGPCDAIVNLYVHTIMAGKTTEFLPKEIVAGVAKPNLISAIHEGLAAICRAVEDNRSGEEDSRGGPENSAVYTTMMERLEKRFSAWPGYQRKVDVTGARNIQMEFKSLSMNEVVEKFQRVYAKLDMYQGMRKEAWNTS